MPLMAPSTLCVAKMVVRAEALRLLFVHFIRRPAQVTIRWCALLLSVVKTPSGCRISNLAPLRYIVTRTLFIVTQPLVTDNHDRALNRSEATDSRCDGVLTTHTAWRRNC